jgi:hypothetical protein
MLGTEYMRQKNRIIKRVTGCTLVKESNIIDVPKTKLYTRTDSIKHLEASLCLYCVTGYDFNGCEKCPIAKNGDACDTDGSSWRICRELWERLATEKDIQELKDLIEEYNND